MPNDKEIKPKLPKIATRLNNLQGLGVAIACRLAIGETSADKRRLNQTEEVAGPEVETAKELVVKPAPKFPESMRANDDYDKAEKLQKQKDKQLKKQYSLRDGQLAKTQSRQQPVKHIHTQHGARTR